jgi:ATP-dependent protease HslVU (ClpYQ) peptidase subunit
MSVVAARVYDDRIEIAADSSYINGSTKLNGAENKVSKLFRIGDCVIGGVGESEELNLFKRYCKDHLVSDLDEDKFLDLLIAFKKWKKEICENGEIEDRYMIAANGKCFTSQKLFVIPIDDYYAVGAGESFARGAMYMGATPVEAVKAASDLSVYVGGPIMMETIHKT